MSLPKTSTFKKEKLYWSLGHNNVVGVDEVGRGCFAGPVVAAAVVFDKNHKRIQGVTDSKRLSVKERTELKPQICNKAKSWAIGNASVEEINSLGILQATFLAMERAILQLSHVDIILVDGSICPKFHKIINPVIETIVKGDLISYSIASASIIAKVWRDELMSTLHLTTPQYVWNKNKGYGTLEHREALKQFGMTEHHRKLFCRNTLDSEDSITNLNG